MTVHTPAARTGLIAVLACIILASPARAQMPASEVPAQTPPGWLLTPAITVGGGWDSNVSLAGRGAETREDFLTTVGPRLTLGLRGRRTTLRTEYDGRYDFHNELTAFDRATHRGNLDLSHRAGRRVTLFARNRLAITPTTEGVDLAAIQLQRRTTRFNDFRGGADVAVGRHTTVTAAYASKWIAFARDDLVQPLLRGGHAHLADVALRRALTSRLTIGAQYDFQHAIVSDGGDAFDIQHAMALAELQLGPALALTGSAGQAWLGAGRDVGRRDAPIFRVGLAMTRPRLGWSLEYGRSYLPSFGFGGTMQNEEVVGTLRLPMTRRFAFTGRAGYRENDPLAAGDTSLRAITAQASLTCAATGWLHLEVYGQHAFQDAQRAGGQVDRTQVGVRLATLKPMRVR